MKNLIRKSILFGMGALTFTKEKAEKFVKELEEKGEVTSEEAKEFVNELVKKGQQERNEIKETVQRELTKLRSAMGLITKDDLSSIEERLRRIEARLGLGPNQDQGPDFPADE